LATVRSTTAMEIVVATSSSSTTATTPLLAT
jgi:hypothetical protein